jgi:hypothetical protein
VLVGLAIVQGAASPERSLAQDGRIELTALAGAIEDQSGAPVIAALLMFLPGALLGVIILSVALWRSRAVPRGAILLLPLFALLDFFLDLGLIGHAVGFIAAAWIAWGILQAGGQGSVPLGRLRLREHTNVPVTRPDSAAESGTREVEADLVPGR